MQSDVVAGRYASALFAIEGIDPTKIKDELVFITEVLDSNEDIFEFFISPMITPNNKKKIIQKCFSGKISAITMNLLLVLCEKKREGEFVRIQQFFCHLHDKKIDKVRANITVATEFPASINDEIKQELASLIKKEATSFGFEKISSETTILCDTKINETILGGVTIGIGDQYLDASVFRYLNNWKKQVASQKIDIDRCWSNA